MLFLLKRLTGRIFPHSVPALLVLLITLSKSVHNGLNQFSAHQSVPIIILRKIVIGTLAGCKANCLTSEHQKVAHHLNLCTIWNIDCSADPFQTNPLPCDIVLIIHEITSKIKVQRPKQMSQTLLKFLY